MEENKTLNNNEIENEKQKLQQKIKGLDIYENCNNYKLDKFLRYFPNKATEIKKCFREEGKNVLLSEKKEQLQNIIMKELCSLLYPCIEKGYKVKQLNDDYVDTREYSIYLNAPENNKYISISIGKNCKTVSTNAEFDKNYGNKEQCFLKSGIQINHHNDEDNKFHNEIEIFDFDMEYTLIIDPDTKTIKLTDFGNFTTYTTFCDKKKEIFKDKEDIIHFFSTLSFAEIEQVLQVSNEHLKNKNYNEVNIKTVLKKIKDTIEENRTKEKKNEEKKDEEKKDENKEEVKEEEEEKEDLHNYVDNDSKSMMEKKLQFSENSDINDNDEEHNEDDKSETKKNDVFNNKFDENYIKNNELFNEEDNENTKTVLDERKDTIEENRKEEKKEEEKKEDNNIDNETNRQHQKRNNNNQNNTNNISDKGNEQKENNNQENNENDVNNENKNEGNRNQFIDNNGQNGNNENYKFPSRSDGNRNQNYTNTTEMANDECSQCLKNIWLCNLCCNKE